METESGAASAPARCACNRVVFEALGFSGSNLKGRCFQQEQITQLPVTGRRANPSLSYIFISDSHSLSFSHPTFILDKPPQLTSYHHRPTPSSTHRNHPSTPPPPPPATCVPPPSPSWPSPPPPSASPTKSPATTAARPNTSPPSSTPPASTDPSNSHPVNQMHLPNLTPTCGLADCNKL